MARKRRSYRRGYRAGRRSYRKKGIFGGIKLLDVSQGVLNGYKLGYVDAGKMAMQGNFEGAAIQIAGIATNPNTMVDLALDNIVLGINRKIIRAFGGRFVRQYIA